MGLGRSGWWEGLFNINDSVILNDDPSCHVQASLMYFQEWVLHHFPGSPFTEAIKNKK